MKYIKVESGNSIDGFNQLIESKKNGEYAIWEYGGFITTTDDVPENYDELEYSEVIRLMKLKAFERYESLENAKNKDVKKRA